MNTKPIRKLPELKENQEWSCEGGCDVVRPKKFENVFSESFANDGSSINRQSEFYFTCQNNHLLEVWSTDTSDSVMLPDEFYQEEASKVVQSNSLEESINLLSSDIDSIKDAFIEESFLTNDDAETLEVLITRAIQLGELFALRDAKPQTVPEGFVLVPKDLSDDFCKQHATKKFESFKPLWLRENFGATEDELERAKDNWISFHINRLKENHKEMIKAQEQSHD